MQDIKELVSLLERQMGERLPFLQLKTNRENKEESLYLKIQAGEYATDEQAAMGVYGNKPNSGSYIMLKSRLKNRLLNHLLFLKEEEPITKVQRNCHLSLIQANILLQNGKASLAKSLLKEIEKISKEMEFTNEVIDCLEKLNTIYTYYIRNNKEFHANRALLQEYYTLQYAERESDDIVNISHIIIGKSMQSRTNFLHELDDNVARLAKLHQAFPGSFNLFYNYIHLKLWRNEQHGEFEDNIRIIQELEEMNRNQQLNVKKNMHLMEQAKYTLIYAYLRTKRYAEGLAVMEQFYHTLSGFNWFTNLENYYLLAMHTQQYALALQVLSMVFENKEFMQLPSPSIERWRLYEGYLLFVYPESEKKFKGYKSYPDFTTWMVKQSTDKPGMYIATQLLKFLNHLKNNETDSVNNCIEWFRKYSSTHVTEQEQMRVKTFLKMFQVLRKENFHPQQSEVSAKKLVAKLKNTRPPGDAYSEIEIIPYETVWDKIIELLDNNFDKNAFVTTYTKTKKKYPDKNILVTK